MTRRFQFSLKPVPRWAVFIAGCCLGVVALLAVGSGPELAGAVAVALTGGMLYVADRLLYPR